jgi:hypothetical protein
MGEENRCIMVVRIVDGFLVPSIMPRKANMAKGPDFSKKTADTLAKRAAQWCSNPDCLNKTSGPHSEPGKAINIGEAAHIRGAKPGSARYDPTMTDEQRSDISNGIWLCRLCARKIDTDEKRFPAKLLLIWREGHEQLVQDRGIKTHDDSHIREELHCLQQENIELRRKNEELSRKLKEKEVWEDRKKRYEIFKANGGVVWLYTGNPQHYACPSCFEKENIQILQDQDNVAGTFKCPGCKEHFHIKPRKTYQKSATSTGNPHDFYRTRSNV